MACETITAGRKLACKGLIGGLKNVYFINSGTDVTISADDTVAASDFADATAYKYELNRDSSLTQNIQANRENGTVVFEQVVELTLLKITAEDNKQIKLLSFGRPHVVVEDYNGNFLLVGAEHGADVTGGTIVTGTAMGDFSGYTLTLTGMEKTPANSITGNFIGGTEGTDGPTISLPTTNP